MKDGFIKVAAASPMIKVADADYNAGKVIECMKKAADKGVKVLVFPELTLTGCSCYDLVGHSVILRGAERALEKVIEASAGSDMLVIVGLPYAPRGGALYSVAAVILFPVPKPTAHCLPLPTTRAARRPFAASSTPSLTPSCCLQAMCCPAFQSR